MTILAKEKFTPTTHLAKTRLKDLRTKTGHSVKEGASLMGVNTKVLEDMESRRRYGKWLSWDEIVEACKVYAVKPDYFLE